MKKRDLAGGPRHAAGCWPFPPQHKAPERPQLVIPGTNNRPPLRPEPMPGLKKTAAPSSSSASTADPRGSVDIGSKMGEEREQEERRSEGVVEWHFCVNRLKKLKDRGSFGGGVEL